MDQKTNFHYLSAIQLNENTSVSTIEVLRVGRIHDRGLEISAKMLEDYVRNFKENAYGTDIQINLGHNREGEAGGWIKDLYIKGEKLMASVEWTELGREKVAKKLYKFVSAELAPRFPRHTDGQLVDNVFVGAALTNTPALKDQQPIGLSEELQTLFFNQNNRMFEIFLSDLLGRQTVSKHDKALAMAMLSSMPADQQEKCKEDMKKLAEKPDQNAVVEEDCKEYEGLSEEEIKKKKAEKAAKIAAEMKDKEQKLSEQLNNVAALSEKASKLEKENVELREKLSLQTLNEDIEKTLTLSETVKTGFPTAKVPEVSAFMQKLSDEQRVVFKNLVGMIQTVQLGEIGENEKPESKNQQAPAGDDKDGEVTKLAEKLMKENKDLGIRDAQKRAHAEIYKA